jgi:hypothetical protein
MRYLHGACFPQYFLDIAVGTNLVIGGSHCEQRRMLYKLADVGLG